MPRPPIQAGGGYEKGSRSRIHACRPRLRASSCSQSGANSDPSFTSHISAADKRTTGTPCRNVAKEVVKIEESYWIPFPNGQQTHIRVKPNTKIDSPVKVGDNIAAQLMSNGDAEALIKLSEKAESIEFPKPDKNLCDMR